MNRIYIILFLLLSFFSTGISFAQTPDASQQKMIRYYPNPASGNINFEFQRNYKNTYTLVVFNFIGKKVFEQRNTPSRLNLNLDGYFRGIYIFQLRDPLGNIVESGKFQVVK